MFTIKLDEPEEGYNPSMWGTLTVSEEEVAINFTSQRFTTYMMVVPSLSSLFSGITQLLQEERQKKYVFENESWSPLFSIVFEKRKNNIIAVRKDALVIRLLPENDLLEDIYDLWLDFCRQVYSEYGFTCYNETGIMLSQQDKWKQPQELTEELLTAVGDLYNLRKQRKNTVPS